jgi:hypothetical protein
VRRAEVVGALICAIASVPSAARATGACPGGTAPQPVDGGGAICIPVADPGGTGGSGSSGSDGGSTGGTDPISGGGDAVEDICDLVLAEPQPPASDPAWLGRSPDDGDLYLCVLPGTGNPDYRFVPNSETTPPDPAALARRALDQLKLTVPSIGLAPSPPAKTYVGLPTWLWMPADQWSTLRKSVTAGSTTVTVAAVPKRATWQMGAGSTTCFGPGRRWMKREMPAGAETTCEFTYQRVSDFEPDRKFKVAAAITFDVSWKCSGACLAPEGSLGEVDGLPGGSAIQVGERQSVNTTSDGA